MDRTALAVLAVLLALAVGPPGPAAAVEEPVRPGSHDAVPAPAGGLWPLSPRPVVTEHFSPPTSPWGAGHRGVDLAARVGQPVLAVLAGRVSFAARLAGRGVVVVDHGPTRTTYEPVVADVAVGDRVGPGDHLGRLELVGSHCLPAACLHWGWRRGGTYLDPLDLVGAGPVRLFPLDAASLAPVPDRMLRLEGAPAGRPPGVGHW